MEHNDVLYHHGILGQKWGVRRFQNKDGSVTPAGAERYYKNGGKGRKSKLDVKKSTQEYGSYQDITTLISKSGGTKKAKAEIDRLAKNKDYDEARKFNDKAESVLDEYINNGEDSAMKLLDSEFGGYDVEFLINHEKELIEDGYEYVTYTLTVYGDKGAYNVSGESDYSDEEYFIYDKYKGNPEKQKARDEIYDKTSKQIDQLYDDMQKYIEDTVKEKTGFDYDTAYKEAVKQNKLIDSGKLKYEDSIWAVINDAEDYAYENEMQKRQEIYDEQDKALKELDKRKRR